MLGNKGGGVYKYNLFMYLYMYILCLKIKSSKNYAEFEVYMFIFTYKNLYISIMNITINLKKEWRIWDNIINEYKVDESE